MTAHRTELKTQEREYSPCRGFHFVTELPQTLMRNGVTVSSLLLKARTEMHTICEPESPSQGLFSNG